MILSLERSPWRKSKLGELVDDLTEPRWISVSGDDDVIDPTIKSATHTISVSQITPAVSVKITKRLEILPGDLVFSRLHTQNGAFAFSTARFTATGTFIPLRVKEGVVDKRFLFWALHIWVPTLSTSDSVGRETYKTEDILSLELPLPSLSEQQRIVARVDALARRVEEARGLRRAAVEEAEAIFGAAILKIFDGEKKTEWTELTLGDITTDVQYGTSEKADDDQSGVPVLRMGNIQNGKLSLGDLKYSHLSAKEVEKLRLQTGDILVNRTNSAELVGKCAVFEEPKEFVYASYIIRLRLNLSQAVPKLIAAYINSPIGRQYMFDQRKQMTGQANVNSQKLRALPLRLLPLADQHRIVAYLDDLQAKVDELRRLQAATQEELDALMPSILAKVFAGEL